MSNDSHLFRTREQLNAEGFTLDGNVFRSATETWLPLYEAKMFHQFTHRWASAESQEDHPIVDLRNPNAQVFPRYWVSDADLPNGPEDDLIKFNLAYRWIARTTDERTCIATVVPHAGFGNSSPIFKTAQRSQLEAMLPAVLTSFVCDFVTRQKLGGANLTFGTMNQVSVLGPAILESHAAFILPRVLELTYTAWDLQMFARECGYNGPPFRWDEERRFLLRCELDAAFFHMYLKATISGDWLIATKQGDSPYDETIEELDELKKHFPKPRDAVAYMMETFTIIKRKDLAYSEAGEEPTDISKRTFKTKATILGVYDAMSSAKLEGKVYKSLVNPPPGPPTDTHGNIVEVSQLTQAEWPSHIHKQTDSAND